MRRFTVDDFDSWRAIARQALAAGIEPRALSFQRSKQEKTLFDDEANDDDLPSSRSASPLRLSKEFIALAQMISCHRDPNAFNLLYRLGWRVLNGEPLLLRDTLDDDVARAVRWQQQVRRDAHKAKAFVRFRPVGEQKFFAWHRPDHWVLKLIGPFFARRFPNVEWMIGTPLEIVTWNRRKLEYGAGMPTDPGADADACVDLWKTYYASTYNPARTNVSMMKREMPVRYWATMPETALIQELLTAADSRTAEMIIKGETPVHPANAGYTNLHGLNEAARSCSACELCEHATQTVVGRGPPSARLILVGEQPGDEEDRTGQPFVGPAGRLLEELIAEAGIDREWLYVTNAVKHFYFVERGERRLHKRPSARHLAACQPWLHRELELVRPVMVLCLGVTAAQSLIAADFRMNASRGKVFSVPHHQAVMATYHPSAIVRAPSAEAAARMRSELLANLRQAFELSVARPAQAGQNVKR